MTAGIKSLTIKGFKGFANEITIDFTRKAKNLVIYGENGSGKTSIMEALKILFDSASNKIELEEFRNIFTKNEIEISIKRKTGGDISLKTRIEKGKNDKGTEKDVLVTDPDGYSPDEKTYLEALSRSTSILSYRRLMKIYDMKTDEDFYDLFIRKIMAYYLIPPKRERTLLQELEDLEKLKKESPRARKRMEEKEKSIKEEINKIFTEIKDKWNEYIKIFTGDDIEVVCSIEKLGSLDFKVKWNGKDVRNILNYLNEGRLNAIALGLFLAYYKKFNVSPYKLLLLDDVVIGLDMSLRLPLLEIIKEDFEKEYQIIITTFDENWFNLMKNYLDDKEWRFFRLIIRNTDNGNLPFLIGIENSDYLNKAEYHWQNGDYSAAALYVRIEFERIVTKYAKERGLRVKFKTNKIEDVWNVVQDNLPRSKILCRRVNTYRSILLNPAVHYDSKPRYKKEVIFAIETVKQLKEKIMRELKKKKHRVE